MPDALPTLDLSAARHLGPDLEQYFGLWAIEPQRGLALWEHACRLDLRVHLAQHAGEDVSTPAVRRIDAAGQSIADGKTSDVAIAVIDIEGTLTKRGSSLSGAGSTIEMRRALRHAVNDPGIGAIVLRIDSPGGTVAGTADLGNEVAAAAAVKPVTAFVEDLAASAAYWVASQARRIVANNGTALVGSIGTLLAFYDLSRLAQNEGVKPVVIATGPYKGLGFPGTEVTEAQKAHLQQLVDGAQIEFNQAIARGRKMPLDKVSSIADGRVHRASVAKDMGLVDAIQSFDATLRELAGEAQAARGRTSTTRRSSAAMSTATETAAQATTDTPAKPAAATLAELKAACPGAGASFLLEQVEKGATLAQATSAFITHQQSELAKREDELKAARAANTGTTGVQPLNDGDRAATAGAATSGTATETFWAAVNERVKGGMKRSQAISLTAKEDPERHAAMISEANTGRKTTRA